MDAGTVELVRSVGPKIFTSADLVQKYEACWTAEQLESHLAAGEIVDRIIREAFQLAAKGARDGKPLTEYVLKQWILKEFESAGVTAEEGPDVAVGPNASDPHYGPVEGQSSPIREGELLLLDVWAKKKTPGSVYYDVTWTGFLGAKVPEEYAKCGAQRDQRRGLRQVFFPSHGPQHRGERSRQRGQHGWARDARYSPLDSAHVHIDRAGNLFARLWDPQRSECLHWRARSSRDRCGSAGDFTAPRVSGLRAAADMQRRNDR